jgi:hypothetical protein
MLINCEHSLKYRQINTIVSGGELDFNDSEEVRADVDD